MKKNKQKTIINQEDMTIRANLNNLEPGDSVNKERTLETANSKLAKDEIQQQNNNL
ncbi:hypothetical protein J14TS2_51660 [Bacillus sp. J14TS2]|uniref:hypothetical protein n=1 Tax=unclassified Bacillus (in: firmicutes) TaxID=185979 RepID=UPI001A95920A|nr:MULTISPECIES: hypothetical protein [unclassified Bacillus (in: firmicutes)]MBO0993401.1 hypothetical protein [Bacillus sp. SD088]GIN74691.1 hypothetical protein J14TS2_51660 [Bacillus sp. J14TS2]